MFFYIGTYTPFLKKNHARLFLDEGWTLKNDSWYKGYSTDCLLADNIDSILNGYTPRGIWCVIHASNNEYKIYHPSLRGFPIYKRNDDITNIPLKDFVLDYCTLPYNNNTLQYEEVVNNIKDVLVENCTNFYNTHMQPFEVWCTGGIDSLSVISILEYAELPYKIYIAKPKKFNGNLREFEGSVSEYSSSLLKKVQNDFWGYKILSNFRGSKILTTGFYGDEFVCRGPYQLNCLSNIDNKSIIDLVSTTDYMYPYIQKTDKKEKFTVVSLNEVEAKTSIKRILSNDFQMWHIDNTLTFSPYYDERIIDNVLSLPKELIIEKAIDASLQKDILKLCFFELMQLVDSYKNQESGRTNFFLRRNLVDFKFCEEIELV